MTYNFEFLDIILLAMIAAFVFLRLRGILGRKTGHSKPYNKLKNEIFENDNKEVNEAKDISLKNGFSEEAKKHFLNGAKMAYESIITAFAKGDKPSLKPLLSKKVFAEFASAIDDRNSKQLKSETTFIGLKSVKIDKFNKEDNIYNVKVKFVSEIITCVKDKNNKIIEGNPDVIKTVNDVWKFSKNMWSQNPTWYLVDTTN